MTTGLASGIADDMLDYYVGGGAPATISDFYVQLHTGDPGALGTASPFGDTTRQSPTFSAASGGAVTNSSAGQWTNLSAGGTISHVSFWTASTSGTFLGSDALEVPRTVSATDDFTIAVGDIDLTLGAVAA